MPITTGPLVLEQFAEGINRNLDTIDRYLYSNAMPEYPVISAETPFRHWVQEFQMIQGLARPQVNRDLEAPPQVSPVKGPRTVIRQTSYRSQLIIEETAVRVSDHQSIYDNVEDLITSIKTLKDVNCVNFFNNGFTNGLSTNITEVDGTARAPFSTGHVYESGGPTWSNYNNVAVPPNVDTVYQLIFQYLKRLQDQNGTTANPAYGVAAEEIIRSDTRPDTANRATNILRGIQLSHVALNQLTSTSKWFLIVDTSDRAYPLRRIQAIDSEITPLEKNLSGNPHAMSMTARSQFSFGWRHSYRGITATGT
jgi:hypothetical protein